MGVNNFWKIRGIGKNKKKSIKDFGNIISLTDLHGKCLAIDASVVIYQCLFAGLRFTKYDDSYLIILEKKIIKYIKNNVKLIWVFDNINGNKFKTSDASAGFAGENILSDKCYNTNTIRLTPIHVYKTMNLLKQYNIKYIVSPINIEAEHVCVMLVHNKKSDYILTCDSDALLFNGSKNRTILVKGKGDKYIAYSLDIILLNIGLTYVDLVKVCVALGTDFNKKIPGVGPITVKKKLQNGKLKFTKKQRHVIKMYMKQKKVIK